MTTLVYGTKQATDGSTDRRIFVGGFHIANLREGRQPYVAPGNSYSSGSTRVFHVDFLADGLSALHGRPVTVGYSSRGDRRFDYPHRRFLPPHLWNVRLVIEHAVERAAKEFGQVVAFREKPGTSAPTPLPAPLVEPAPAPEPGAPFLIWCRLSLIRGPFENFLRDRVTNRLATFATRAEADAEAAAIVASVASVEIEARVVSEEEAVAIALSIGLRGLGDDRCAAGTCSPKYGPSDHEGYHVAGCAGVGARGEWDR